MAFGRMLLFFFLYLMYTFFLWLITAAPDEETIPATACRCNLIFCFDGTPQLFYLYSYLFSFVQEFSTDTRVGTVTSDIIFPRFKVDMADPSICYSA